MRINEFKEFAEMRNWNEFILCSDNQQGVSYTGNHIRYDITFNNMDVRTNPDEIMFTVLDNKLELKRITNVQIKQRIIGYVCTFYFKLGDGSESDDHIIFIMR